MSFIPVDPDSDFPIENLPFGVFSRREDPKSTPHIGVAIGYYVLDLSQIATLFTGPILSVNREALLKPTLNAFMSLGKPAWSEARTTLQRILSKNEGVFRDNGDLRERAVIPQKDVNMHLPADIGDYTNFNCSLVHATNLSVMSPGPDTLLNPLIWPFVPGGYNGRASSVVISGTPVKRPVGQTHTNPDPREPPVFEPSKMLDFGLETAFFVGPGNQLGQPIPVLKAEDNIFGMVLLNNWCAHDILKWEIVPPGQVSFVGRDFCTTISPWVVTMDALQPFLVPNTPQVPPPLPYLIHPDPFNFDISLTVGIKPETTQTESMVCKSNLMEMYWTMKQQLAHHSVTGCNMRPGDLLASGVISGKTPDSFGSMLELACKGTKPIALKDGEPRIFLMDGDEVIMRGSCKRGDCHIGFGEARGKVLPTAPL